MEEHATRKELQEHTSTIIEAMNSMFDALSRKIDESAERTENRIRAYIETGVEKKVDILGEQVMALTGKVNAMEDHIGRMSERIEGIDIRMTAVEQNQREINQRLDNLEHGQEEIMEAIARHDGEIISLRQAR